MNHHLSGKELFIRFTARAFRKLLSIYVFSYFPFGFEGRIWDLTVSVPDHCLSFYFTTIQYCMFPVRYQLMEIPSFQVSYLLIMTNCQKLKKTFLIF